MDNQKRGMKRRKLGVESRRDAPHRVVQLSSLRYVSGGLRNESVFGRLLYQGCKNSHGPKAMHGPKLRQAFHPPATAGAFHPSGPRVGPLIPQGYRYHQLVGVCHFFEDSTPAKSSFRIFVWSLYPTGEMREHRFKAVQLRVTMQTVEIVSPAMQTWFVYIPVKDCRCRNALRSFNWPCVTPLRVNYRMNLHERYRGGVTVMGDEIRETRADVAAHSRYANTTWEYRAGTRDPVSDWECLRLPVHDRFVAQEDYGYIWD